MSATGRGATRVPSDFYPTPAWAVRRLLEHVPLPSGTWLEPSAGDGAIIRAVNGLRSNVQWHACELRDECFRPLAELARVGVVSMGDFLAMPLAGLRFEVAILNPPFSHAQQFIQRCKERAGYVAALERLNFLEGQERNEWFRRDAPDVYILPERPSFTGAGTDSIAYAWFVWTPARGRGFGQMHVLPTTPAAERRVPRLVLPEGVGEPLQGGLL